MRAARHLIAEGSLRVAHSWDGSPLRQEACVELELSLGDGQLSIRFAAPFHGDPLPQGPPTMTEGLWEYEVVELFLLGAEGQYVELEFGTGGHYLALALSARRIRSQTAIDLTYRARLANGRWLGEAELDARYLPSSLVACNAYAIHGQGDGRRFLAAYPVAGAVPDFHRLECFGPLPWVLSE